MQFTVSQSSLAKALLVVAKGMATNSTLPYLSGIYIRAAEGTLEFQTANLTISIRHRIAAKAIQIIRREAAKPENQRKAREFVGKMRNRRR